MTRIKSFNDFDINEAKAEVVMPTTIDIPKKIADEIELAKDMHVEIDKLTEEFMKKITPMKKTVEKYDADVLGKMKDLKINQLKVKNIIVTFVQEAGKTTYSYKQLWEEGLKKVNEATRKMLLTFQESIKNIGKGKEYLEYGELQKESVSEGVKDMFNKFIEWVKGWWTKLSDGIDKYIDEVVALEKTAAKAVKENEEHPATTKFVVMYTGTNTPTVEQMKKAIDTAFHSENNDAAFTVKIEN